VEEVWVLVTSAGSGKNLRIGDAVYGSKDAVLDDLGKMPNMTVSEDSDGVIRGRPLDEPLRDGRWPGHWLPRRWAEARPVRVHHTYPSATCPVCGMTTYSEMDIREGYCGNCHDWTSLR
jgi:hypothetical protein